ncbi:MAG: Asp-tRNA(Asn)/Glu-tRNA(Gln) amidotransferase subunit GatC [Actinomycetota bacterium]|nr:Asp-tRNA(Asn)/Glu-tRNA(Gln) amidotransferase subunit GatC [Actinomycetota bacterium]
MERISKDDVKHVAKLAELEFDEKDVDKITTQLDRILDHVANISKVDTEGIPPTSHVMDVKNVFREDEVKESVTQEDALKNAPDMENQGFKVPKID